MKKLIKKFLNSIIENYKIFYFLKNSKEKEKLKILLFNNHSHYIELIYLIKIKLELMKKELKKDLDFDEKDFERLNDLINQANNLISIIKQKGLTEKDEEYQRLARSFFNKLYRLHSKLYSIREYNFKD